MVLNMFIHVLLLVYHISKRTGVEQMKVLQTDISCALSHQYSTGNTNITTIGKQFLHHL